MKRSPAKLEAVERELSSKWKFSELLEDPNILERWEKVRKYFFLRESTYDMTNRCNIKCDGCYYYSGGKQFAQENRDPEAWHKLMKEEKARGITYVVLAGAEPALVPESLQACFDEINPGCIASNGFKHIAKSVGYKIHVSVWGNDETSARVRKVKNLMPKQIENYQGDPRAVFVYTFCRANIPETYDVVKTLAKNNCKVTFNVFSAPVGYTGELRHTPETLAQTRRAMVDLLTEYPEHVLFSPYSAVAHTSGQGLHKLYKCSYPRMNPSKAVGLGRSFRQYRADLTWDRSASCCVPDTDCEDCRHYASGSAVVTARLYRHTGNPDIFKSWLDYVDTYLAVWVMGYDKGKNLCKHSEPAPGFTLD
ncbi:MAG: radical SAM protein [bacterium]|nr:radical SAM protein [bacterium]